MPSVLLRSEEIDGRMAIVESVIPAGAKGPPLHRHDFDETFYIAEGEVTFQVQERVFTAKAGEVVHAPGGVAHTWSRRDATAPARWLLVIAPAGFERYFARMTAEREGVDPPAWAHGDLPPVEHLGPPIGD
jgi:quercetin dioxygenase-like cupin family protein